MVYELNSLIATHTDWNVWSWLHVKQDINLPQRLRLLLLENAILINNLWTVFSNEQLPSEYSWQCNDKVQLTAVYILLALVSNILFPISK